MNVEHEVREMLRRAAEAIQVQPAPWATLRRRAARVRRVRWMAGGLSVATAVVAVAMVASTLTRENGVQVPTRH